MSKILTSQQKDLVFIIAIWQRHDLTKVVFKHLAKMQKKFDFGVVVAGSEGKKSKDLVNPFGFEYIETDNRPLSHKNNAMLLEAKKLDPKAVVILGSDDFVDENVVQFYYDLIEKNVKEVYGFTNLYFYGTHNKKLSHYNTGKKSYGAGRYFPRYALDKADFKGWKGSLNKGLDGNNKAFMTAKGIEFKSVSLESIKGFLVDVKHTVNITKKDIVDIGQEVPRNKFTKHKVSVLRDLDKLSKVFEPSKEQQEQLDKLQYPDDMMKDYNITGTGKSKHIKAGVIYKVKGFQAKLLIRKGNAILC
jgi:hypothetical protein